MSISLPWLREPLIFVILFVFSEGCQPSLKTTVAPTAPISKIAEKVSITGTAGALERLTIGGPHEEVASLSPDHKWLLLNVRGSEDKNSVIFKFDLEGKTNTILTPKDSDNREGDWLNDMSGMVFVTNRTGNYVLCQSLGIAGGVGIRFITIASLGNARFPDVAPNGKEIAFSVFTTEDNSKIAIVDISGNELRMFGSGWAPQFSPDGKTLCFSRKEKTDIHIYTMNVKDGTSLIQLTNGTSKNYGASWSPSGNQLAFTSTRAGNRHLFIMDTNGQNVLQLTDGAFEVRYSKWGGDGYIYFSANAGDNWDVWRLKPLSEYVH